MTDSEIELLREWTDVSDAEAGELHRRVMVQVARRRRAPWWLAAAAALLIAMALGWRALPEVETLALRMPPAPVAPNVRLTTVAKPGRDREGERASLFKIYTDDPEVVILLVANGGEE